MKPNLTASQAEGCSPLSVHFSENESGYSYFWDFDDGLFSYQRNPEHMFFNDSGTDTTFIVKQKASTSQGCEDSTTHEVTVYTNPVPDFEPSRTQICSGQDVDFQNTSLYGVSYEWEFGNLGTSTDESPTYTFYNETEKVIYVPVTLTATTENMCIDSITKYITVYPYPDKGIELSDTAGCHPLILELSTQSFGATYEWDFGDGTIEVGAQRVEHIFVNNTSEVIAYPVTLNVSTNQGCGAEFNETVYVYPSPEALFALDTNVGCSPYVSEITNISEGATSYTWMIDEEVVDTISASGFEFYLSNKTTEQKSHRIDLMVQNEYECTSNYSKSVLVYPEVHAEFATHPIEGCSPFNVDFENQSTGANSYNWLFDDNTESSNEHTQHTYVNIGKDIETYDVQLVAVSAFSCVDTSDVTQIEVYPQPKVAFNASPISGCSPLQTIIEDQSEGVLSATWDYGDGTVSTGLQSVYEYSNTTSDTKVFSLKLIGENEYGCSDTSTLPITVYPEVLADYSIDTVGCSPLPVSFTNQTIHAEKYAWDFGDSSV
ncbi:MAG: PKD domain-containing protein [Bacteroidales bacterium]